MFPYFRGQDIPTPFKAFLALSLSLLFYLPLSEHVRPFRVDPFTVLTLVTSEMITGVIFSLSLLIVLGAFEVAGDIVSFQMGFGFARVADPVTGVQITLVSRFFEMLAVLIFFAIDGHHFVIRAIYESFEKIPLGSMSTALSPEKLDRMVAFSGIVFSLALKIAAPIMIALFLGELGMGLIVKFAPQINILVVGFAFTIILGILFAAFSIEAWSGAVARGFKMAAEFLFQVLLP